MESLLSDQAFDYSQFKDDGGTETWSKIAFHYQSFAKVLREIVPLWDENRYVVESNARLPNVDVSVNSKEKLIQWLYTKCLEIQKQQADDALVLAVTLVSTIQTFYIDSIVEPLVPIQKGNLSQQNHIELQAALFDILGETDYGTNFLFELVPMVQQLNRYKITPQDVYSYTEGLQTNPQNQQLHTQHDMLIQENLDYLRLEALEKAQQVAIVKAQLEQIQQGSEGMTHSLHKKTREKTLWKEYKKISKEAAHALQLARQQGAILEDDPILRAISMDHLVSSDDSMQEEEEIWRNELGGRGLGSLLAQNRLHELTSQLLPENSRVYYTPKSFPKGTLREHKEGYEMVTIPPPSSSVYVNDTSSDNTNKYPRLIISDVMNSVESQAFEGTKTLNPMQSAVFSTAFHTRENMLICAPTGAGKTNVAMLAVVAHLRNVGILVAPTMTTTKASSTSGSNAAESVQDIYSAYQHIGTSSSSATKNQSYTTTTRTTTSEPGRKIVYIAPMKALAQEVVAKFSSKLSKLKIVVQEFTGDMQLSKTEAERSDILVTTPEKWDVITRKGGSDGTLAQSCGLLLMDEIHILADEGRGAVIESIVARLHRLIESSQRHVRIVALSATLPNYKDVAEFLRVDPSKGLYFFGPEFRPVPLLQKFIGVNPISAPPTTTNTSTKQVILSSPSMLSETTDSDPTATSKVVAKSFNKRDALDTKMNEICYEHVIDSLKRGYQVMVFVHSRKGTSDTARYLADAARKKMELGRYFLPHGNDVDDNYYGPKSVNAASSTYHRYYDRVQKSRNREVGQHFHNGIGIHHAGMLRIDRKLTEDMFADGAIRVLCCTATLAWGVNLPAHTVVIKGTEVYNPEKGGNNDLSILDVMQIFGRAGRPQFDSSGEAILITSHDAFSRYLDKLIREVPIESSFIKQLVDHLNAEIATGTVTTISEGVHWLRYTYLFVRMFRNPIAYGITADMKMDDPSLSIKITELIINAAKQLDHYRMARYDPVTGNLSITQLGRIASQFYLNIETIHTFKDLLEASDSKIFSAADLCQMVCRAQEFANVKVRSEELDELDKLSTDECPLNVKAPKEDSSGKCCVLLQAYISNAKMDSFTLISDLNYVTSNAGRIARALFEMFMKKGKADASVKLLRIAKSIDRRLWWFDTPLRQFDDELPVKVYVALENWADHNNRRNKKTETSSFDIVMDLLDMQPDEVGQLCHWFKGGERVKHFVEMLPGINIGCVVQPITRGILRFQVALTPCWKWSPRWHGSVQAFWLFVEDSYHSTIYHHEHVMFHRRTHPEPLEIEITIPAFEPLPSQYFIRLMSDTWVGVEIIEPVSFKHLLLPTMSMPFTDLLDLDPLPISALADSTYEQIYKQRFKHFNPIQTQLFHILYHSDCPVLLGAPTGSGKTTIAEIAIMRMKKLDPQAKCVCIAPLKSLARERLREWKERFGGPPLHWNVLELSGDTNHDSYTMNRADILVSTPEKWDLVSRGWRKADTASGALSDHSRSFVKDVRLLIIDEIHLLGEERGAVLEAIVSRTRFISKFVAQNSHGLPSARESTRIIGLSTSIANPFDLADWIGIKSDSLDREYMKGLYNFRASVRPVPMITHISGFAGRHFCSRMASMNKPAYAAIKQHSPKKPVIIFVASRRQTRLTALDLVSYASNDGDPRAFLNCDDEYIETIASTLSDASLRHTISYGVGLHHAGLSSHDRDTVERLFLKGDVQILVATATLAWGVNLPAHLVIVKGTEYFDAKTSRYIDYPVTDVLQMMGRAGRPQFDHEGISCVFVEESKKNFYKKFLYLPFPLESHLSTRLADNINAEISIGTISTVADAVGYLSWTFFSRRVKLNPSYYGASSTQAEDVDSFFIGTMKETLMKIYDEGCIDINSEDVGMLESYAGISSSFLGRAACNFYLSYKTPSQMRKSIVSMKEMIYTLMNQSQQGSSSNEKDSESNGQVFNLGTEVETFGVSAILYHLAHTHEFDELPVRHNEEFLNIELSRQLPWGENMAFKKGGHSSVKNNEALIDSMKDPHTKCYLLLQAFLNQSQLPISDYENDTRSVIEQIPRLLAAMEYIFHNEFGAYPGGFSLATLFSISRQIINSQTMPGRTNLGVSAVFARDFRTSTSLDKSSGDAKVKIDLSLLLDRNRLHRINIPNQELSISILVGTNEDMLKCYKKEILPISGFKSKSVTLSFDRRVEDKGLKTVMIRIICEDMRTTGIEYSVSLDGR